MRHATRKLRLNAQFAYLAELMLAEFDDVNYTWDEHFTLTLSGPERSVQQAYQQLQFA